MSALRKRLAEAERQLANYEALTNLRRSRGWPNTSTTAEHWQKLADLVARAREDLRFAATNPLDWRSRSVITADGDLPQELSLYALAQQTVADIDSEIGRLHGLLGTEREPGEEG
jgi:hypothetical protein